MCENLGKKMEINKKGITIVALIVTIIISLILISVSVVAVKNSIEKTALTAFAEDLSNIELATQSYYIENDEFPTSSKLEDKSLNQGEVVSLCGNVQIMNEMIANGDYFTNENLGTYYKIDLSLLNVTSTSRGMLKNSEQNDIYVICYPTMNIYYLKGFKNSNNKTYYSLTSDLVSKTQVIDTAKDDNSYTTVQTIQGVSVKTTKKVWTNKVGAIIQATLENGESLHLTIPTASGVSEKQFVNTIIGKNEIAFETLTDLKNSYVPTLTDEEISAFNSFSQSSKYLEIVKKVNGVQVGKIKLDLGNYETGGPTVITMPKVISKPESNWVEFKISDTVSGIKSVRYDYLGKYNEEGSRVQYYAGVDNLEENYMKSKGKKATVSEDGFVHMEIPKDIEGIQIALVDKAGNVTTLKKNMYEDIGIYIGIVPKQISLKQATFKLVFNSPNGVSSGTTSISTNGVDYTAELPFTINNSSTLAGIDIDNYTNLNAKDNIDLKVIVNNFDKTKIETRIKSLTNKDSTQKDSMKVGVVATDNTTINGESATYFNPVIPKGFKAINTATAIWPDGWDNGLVIEDTSGNQFVWVPVTSLASYTRNLTYPKSSGVEITNCINDTLPNGVATEEVQISKYGGFYISRYEAMFDYNGGNTRIAAKPSKNSQNSSLTLDEAHSGYNFTTINYANSKLLSEQMATTYLYDTEKVLTGLVTGIQWDVTCDWIAKEKSVLDSRAWGNYTNSIAPANTGNYVQGVIKPSGSNENWKAKNIYDFAGNLFEWTTEKYNIYYMIRSVGATSGGSVATRYKQENINVNQSYVHWNLGFRPVLYIK